MVLLPRIPNQTFGTFELATNSDLGEFELNRDNQFGFLFNNNFNEFQYSASSYHNEQATSEVFAAHLYKVAGLVEKHYGRNLRVVEIGCGKGDFFRILDEIGFSDLRGFDRTYEGSDSRITKTYVGEEQFPLSADLIILRHVLEHVEKPLSFLLRLVKINGKSCKFVIEVPSLDWILKNNSFWDFTYEHVNYFSEISLKNIFGNGELMSVFNEQYLLLFGDSEDISVDLNQGSRPSPVFEEVFAKWKIETAIFDELKERFRFWIWGGATKGVLFAYHFDKFSSKNYHDLQGIIDINPKKQGSYSAGTGVPIISPDDFFDRCIDGDVVLVSNPAYVEEVASLIFLRTRKKILIKKI